MCQSSPHSPALHPAAPLPAGGAQVCPADDAMLVGRVEPLESRQRPLLDAKAALSHIPKNNIKRDCNIHQRWIAGRERQDAGVAASAPPRSSVGAENHGTTRLPASLCRPHPSLPTSPCTHGHVWDRAPPETGPQGGVLAPSMGICGAAATATPAQPPTHSGPSDQTHRPP